MNDEIVMRPDDYTRVRFKLPGGDVVGYIRQGKLLIHAWNTSLAVSPVASNCIEVATTR
jgi:hypothetical protein